MALDVTNRVRPHVCDRQRLAWIIARALFMAARSAGSVPVGIFPGPDLVLALVLVLALLLTLEAFFLVFCFAN